MAITAPLIPIMLLLVQARRLPPEHALLVAEMAGDVLILTYVSFLDPVMRRLCITRLRGEGVHKLKAKIQARVGIPLEQQILILAGSEVTYRHHKHCVTRLCLKQEVKVRLQVVQNVSLQNVLVASGLMDEPNLSDSFLEEPTGLQVASRSWDNAFRAFGREMWQALYVKQDVFIETLRSRE